MRNAGLIQSNFLCDYTKTSSSAFFQLKESLQIQYWQNLCIIFYAVFIHVSIFVFKIDGNLQYWTNYLIKNMAFKAFLM